MSRVNESVPLFLVQGMTRRMGALKGRKVAVLGLAFKAGTDDERDSLSHKLIRLLERELADVATHDPHVPTPTQALRQALWGAEAVFVATNHSAFERREVVEAVRSLTAPGCVVADPWRALGATGVFTPLGEAEPVGERVA